ncbi:coiled-coil domain-containing protein 28B [Lingula anatina]|uniref:Coiled-coil domain-containing protein 28B n=1 Tax=Lingula anatina TaxID=7574 RepID=A0A1S3IML1_LINAN|nr:coiled-coil domain-containing protein 28B [Lingula anatina]|eukprot:XP_013399475.1 coiled-coil domain-containing protein 28B [Lingula anatina]
MEKVKPSNKQVKNVQSNSKTQMKLDFTDPDEGRRPCKEHSFLTDVAEVREMEQGLLQLLNDFHSGKLQAFGQECSFEKMDQVREQQEKLAKLHFELDAQQDRHKLGSEQGRQLVSQNMEKLMTNLEDLSLSIHNLQKNKLKEKKT